VDEKSLGAPGARSNIFTIEVQMHDRRLCRSPTCRSRCSDRIRIHRGVTDLRAFRPAAESYGEQPALPN
jgi:hypothetical protein